MTISVISIDETGAPSGLRRSNGLLNERQAADLLNVRVATLRRWRWAGKGPAFLKIGGAVRYDPSELTGTSVLPAARLRLIPEAV